MSSLPLQKPDPPVSSLPLPPSSPPRHGVHLCACPVLAASARPRLPRHDAAASPRCVRPATPWPPRCVRPARRATTAAPARHATAAAPARQRRELHGEPTGAMATGPSSIRTPGRAKAAPPPPLLELVPSRPEGEGRRGVVAAATSWSSSRAGPRRDELEPKQGRGPAEGEVAARRPASLPPRPLRRRERGRHGGSGGGRAPSPPRHGRRGRGRRREEEGRRMPEQRRAETATSPSRRSSRSAAAPRTPPKLAVRGCSSRAPPRLEVRGAARWPPWPRAEGGRRRRGGREGDEDGAGAACRGEKEGGEGES